MSSVRTNRYKGTPGMDNFSYKLPKGITVSSIRHAVQIICSSHLLHSDVDLDNEHIKDNLIRIYPLLNPFICSHFVLTRNVEVPSETDKEDESIVSQVPSSNDNRDASQCQICDLKCHDSETICMKCKCMPLRLDQLSMELKKVQHVIDALLDTPPSHPSPQQKNTATLKTSQSTSSSSRSDQPTPPGTTRTRPVDQNPQPRSRQHPSLPTPVASDTTRAPRQPPPAPYQNFQPMQARNRQHPASLPNPSGPPLTQQRYQQTTAPPPDQHRRNFPFYRNAQSQPPSTPFNQQYRNQYPPINSQQLSHSMLNQEPPRDYIYDQQRALFNSRQRASYASALVNPPTSSLYDDLYMLGCENCGEENHRARTCRHGMQLQCRYCMQYGHKAKTCPFYY